MPLEFFDFFDPTPEEQVVVLVEEATVRVAEKLIESCEHCPRPSDPFRSERDIHSGTAGDAPKLVRPK